MIIREEAVYLEKSSHDAEIWPLLLLIIPVYVLNFSLDLQPYRNIGRIPIQRGSVFLHWSKYLLDSTSWNPKAHDSFPSKMILQRNAS